MKRRIGRTCSPTRQGVAEIPLVCAGRAEVFGGKHDPAKLTFPYNLIPALKQMPATDIRELDGDSALGRSA